MKAQEEGTGTVVARVREQLESLDAGKGRTIQPRVSLSIVIPAYNEQLRLPKTVIETIRWCRANAPEYEIVIVDDGSRDETLAVARLFSDYYPNVRVIACPHSGKGSAVRTGMLNASGDRVLFMDADGATPLSEIPKLGSKIDEGYAVAIGSRVVMDRAETVVTTSIHRRVIGRIFAALVSFIAVRGYRDTQCGFKMFRREASRAIFSRQRLNGFAFDVELLHIAGKLSIPVAEVPVNWNNQEESKVDLVRDSLRMFKDMLMIKSMHRRI